jgi:hypothetical protein
MPIPALALIGFMDQEQAVHYLKTRCVPANEDEAALIAQWRSARQRLGAPIERAGFPTIADIPAEHGPYIQQLKNSSWQAAVYAPGSEWQVKLVSIDQLLAFQLHADLARPKSFCATLAQPVGLAQTLPMCLPLTAGPVPVHLSTKPNSALLRSRDLNLRMLSAGAQDGNFIGIRYGGAIPHVQVGRFNGRCYLTNGLHRAIGLRALGVTQMPCLFRDSENAEELGIVGAQDGSTFALPLLESGNPPTCSHFCEARAHPVSLRVVSRVIHVTWSEHVVAEDY